MTEKEILEKGEEKIREVLGKVADIVEIEKKVKTEKLSEIDSVLRIRSGAEEKLILVEARSSGEPKYLRQAIAQLTSYMRTYPKSYGLILAPYISERGAKICQESGVGYVDLSGNAWVKFNSTYIEIAGKGKTLSERRELKKLFSPISTRLLRSLLVAPERKWHLKEISEATGMSLGQAYKVKKKLLNEEYIFEDEKKRFYLKDPSELLNKWREHYNYRKNEIVELFSLDRIPEIEGKIRDYFKSVNGQYAFTLFSGAARVAPHVRYNFAAFYSTGNIEKLKDALSFKRVDSGANILVLRPYDEGVYYGLQEKEGYKIVSNIQLYLDLYGYRGRGQEQAEFLRQELIGF